MFDVSTILPPYALEVLQKKQKMQGCRQELFGRHIKFIPLDWNRSVFPNMLQLNDIALMNENIQNGDVLDEGLENDSVNETHESE